jgi:tetratricopeptide (TPR) repeat protein
MTEFPSATLREINGLCAAGDELVDQTRYAAALDKYWAAWDLLPEPKTDCDAAASILAAIGDANFRSGDFQAGRDNLGTAMHCPNALGNPFLHLRLGQCQYELGNVDRAADELARAFLLEGKKIFANEDPKYLDFVKSKLKPPPGGWPEGW